MHNIHSFIIVFKNSEWTHEKHVLVSGRRGGLKDSVFPGVVPFAFHSEQGITREARRLYFSGMEAGD